MSLSDEEKRRNEIKLEINISGGTIFIEHDSVYYNGTQLGNLVDKNIEDWIELETSDRLIKTVEQSLKNYNRSNEKAYIYKGGYCVWIHNIILKDVAWWLGEPIKKCVSNHLRQIKAVGYKNHPIQHKKNISCDHSDIKKLNEKIKQLKRELDNLQSQGMCHNCNLL